MITVRTATLSLTGALAAFLFVGCSAGSDSTTSPSPFVGKWSCDGTATLMLNGQPPATVPDISTLTITMEGSNLSAR